MSPIETPVSTQDYQADNAVMQNESSSIFGPDRGYTVSTYPQIAFIAHKFNQLPDSLTGQTDNTALTSPNSLVETSPDSNKTWTLDVFDEFMDELERKNRVKQEVIQAYQRRIDVLRSAGAVEDIELNERSEEDFWQFIRSSPIVGQARLFLMGNGNIRAVWKSEDSSHLGLHFLGDQKILYVIFKRCPDSGRMIRTTDSDTFEGVRRKIYDFGLTTLVNV